MKCSSIFLKIHAAPSILIFFRPFFFISSVNSSRFFAFFALFFFSSSLLHLWGLELMTWKYRGISTDHFINWAMWTYQLIKHIFGNHMNLVWLRDLEKNGCKLVLCSHILHCLNYICLNYIWITFFWNWYWVPRARATVWQLITPIPPIRFFIACLNLIRIIIELYFFVKQNWFYS